MIIAQSSFKRVGLAMVVLMWAIASCAPAEPQAVAAPPTVEAPTAAPPTRTPEDTAQPTDVPKPAAATLPPAETSTPLPTQELSPTPMETEAPPLEPGISAETPASLPEGFNAWCVKREVYDQGTLARDGAMPAWGRPAVMKNGKPDLVIEVQSCTFVYTFDQPVEPGTKLVIHDTLDGVFIKQDLIPTEDNPNVGYAVVSQKALVEAQVWTIDFRVAVEDPAGGEIRSEIVSFERGWRPGVCYGGYWPDPVTLLCSELREAHPWDPWYQYSIHGGYNEGVTTPGPIMPPPWEK